MYIDHIISSLWQMVIIELWHLTRRLHYLFVAANRSLGIMDFQHTHTSENTLSNISMNKFQSSENKHFSSFSSTPRISKITKEYIFGVYLLLLKEF